MGPRAPPRRRAESAEFFESGAGAAAGFVVVFFLLREGEGLLEGGFGGGALAVGEEGEAEFDAVRRELRREFGGAREQADGFGGGGVGEAAVDELYDEARRGAEGGDFVVPAAEDVMGVVVGGIEGEGALGVFADMAGVFELGAGVGVGGEFAVADREGEDVDGIGGAEGDGALGVGEGGGAEAFFLGDVGRVEREIGILAREFLENERIVGARGVEAEKEVEGGLRIEAGLGGEGVAEERIGVGGVEAKRREARECGEGEEGAAAGEHRRLLRGGGGRGCEAGECHRRNGGRERGSEVAALARRAGNGYWLSTMIDTIKRTLLAGVGAAVITKEKVEASMDDWVKQGKVSTAEARQVAEKIAEQGRQEFETLSHELNEKLREKFSGNERRTQERIDALEARIAALERAAQPAQAAPAVVASEEPPRGV